MIDPETQTAQPALDLSSADIFRLHTATYLSIVQALNQAGVISLGDMANLLESHVSPDDQEPWSDVVRAFVTVLRRGPAEDAAPETAGYGSFQVIEGGRRL